ncbi:MAG: S49 family peptidase [Bacteroidales bacterium]|nr:S49 family peptidase [Bacteroidales bacterium]
MNPILAEILSGAWLISKERSTAYASILLSMLKGENFSDVDSSIARERNRSYVIGAMGDQPQRFGFSDTNIPEGSVAIIPIRSEILKYDQPCGPRGSHSILTDVKSADQNPNIKSILLVVDSPGGQVTGTDMLAEAICNSATPIVAYIEGMAASAAYWIISGASKIIASSDLDRIGSIGTMLMVEDLQPALEAQGVKFHEIYASLSVDKNSDFNQVLDGKYESYQKNVLDVINSKFLSSIKANRPAVDDSTLTGKMYFAPEAIALGLIDEIGSLEYAISIATALAPVNTILSIETQTNNPNNMKIKETWKTIQSFFKIDPLALDSQELTDDRVQQINDQLGSVTIQNEELKEQLAAEKFAFQMTLAELEALKQQDAATQIVAAKDADKIEIIADEPVYAHDKIADEFCS